MKLLEHITRKIGLENVTLISRVEGKKVKRVSRVKYATGLCIRLAEQRLAGKHTKFC